MKGTYIADHAALKQFLTIMQSRESISTLFFNTKLFMTKRAREVDKKWKDKQRMRKRQKTLQLMEESAQDFSDIELEPDE